MDDWQYFYGETLLQVFMTTFHGTTELAFDGIRWYRVIGYTPATYRINCLLAVTSPGGIS